MQHDNSMFCAFVVLANTSITINSVVESCKVILQIDCTAWLGSVDHDGEGVLRVITRMADMHARTTLGSEEALKLLQRLG